MGWKTLVLEPEAAVLPPAFCFHATGNELRWATGPEPMQTPLLAGLRLGCQTFTGWSRLGPCGAHTWLPQHGEGVVLKLHSYSVLRKSPLHQTKQDRHG